MHKCNGDGGEWGATPGEKGQHKRDKKTKLENKQTNKLTNKQRIITNTRFVYHLMLTDYPDTRRMHTHHK